MVGVSRTISTSPISHSFTQHHLWPLRQHRSQRNYVKFCCLPCLALPCIAFLSFPFFLLREKTGERGRELGVDRKRNVEIDTWLNISEYTGEICLEFANTLWLLIKYAYNDSMSEYPTSVTKGLSSPPVPYYLHPFYSMVFCLFYRYIYFSLVGQKLTKKTT